MTAICWHSHTHKLDKARQSERKIVVLSQPNTHDCGFDRFWRHGFYARQPTQAAMQAGWNNINNEKYDISNGSPAASLVIRKHNSRMTLQNTVQR